MVIATQLTTGGNAGFPITTIDTASVSIKPNTLLLVSGYADNGGGAAVTVTFSGLGLTWTEIANELDAGSNRRITLARAVCNKRASGKITLTFSGATGSPEWSVTQIENVDLTGTNGANAIVQSAKNHTAVNTTSLTVTLGSFSSTNNATYGVIANNNNGNITAGSGFTELGEDNSNSSIQAQYKTTNDTTVDWTWGANASGMAIAVELKFAPSPSAGFLYQIV